MNTAKVNAAIDTYRQMRAENATHDEALFAAGRMLTPAEYAELVKAVR